MAKYLIHACNTRLWYVQDYLIPSMIEQGIDEDNIAIYLDVNNEGCLDSCMKSFRNIPADDGGTWHLQDDVIISSDFKEVTEKFDDVNDAVICGYCYSLDDNQRYSGEVEHKRMWYSFPCIKIPNLIANRCGNWFYNSVIHNREFRMWVRSKKYDDSIFEIFILDYCEDTKVINLKPNIVDHIDYLIGGSVINYIRPEKETHAAFFNDKYLVEELEKKLLTNK